MTTAASRRLMTADELFALPDDGLPGFSIRLRNVLV
jgi:hypothetical protein